MGLYTFLVRCSRLSLSLLLLPLLQLLNGAPTVMVLLPATHLTTVVPSDPPTTLADPLDLPALSPSPPVPLERELSALLVLTSALLARVASTSVLLPDTASALTFLLLPDTASALPRDLIDPIVSKVLSRRPPFTVKRRSTPSTVLSSVTLVLDIATAAPSLAAVLSLSLILTSTTAATPIMAATSAMVVTELVLRSTPQDFTMMSATTSVAPTEANPALTSAMASAVTSPATALSLSLILTSITAVTVIITATSDTVVPPLSTPVDISVTPPVLPLMMPTTIMVTSITDVEAMVMALTAVPLEMSISTVALSAAHPVKPETTDSVVMDITSDLAAAFSLMLATNAEVPTLSVPVVTVPSADSAVLHVLTATRADSTAVSVRTIWTKPETSASEELREMLPSMPLLVLVLPTVFLPEAKLLSLLRTMMVISPSELTMLAELSLRLVTLMTSLLVLADSEPIKLISTVKLVIFPFQITKFLMEPLMTQLVRALWTMLMALLIPALMVSSTALPSSINLLTSTTRVDVLPTAVPITSFTKIPTLPRTTTLLTPHQSAPMEMEDATLSRTTTLTVVTSTKPTTVIMIFMTISAMIAALTDSAVSRTIITHHRRPAALMDSAISRKILTTTVLFTVATAASTTDITDTATTVTAPTDTATTVTDLTDTVDTATAPTTLGENNSFNPFGEGLKADKLLL